MLKQNVNNYFAVTLIYFIDYLISVCLTVRIMTDAELIKQVGTGKLAELCEVAPSAVSQWKRDGIPRARRQYLALLLPSVFGRDVRPELPAARISLD